MKLSFKSLLFILTITGAATCSCLHGTTLLPRQTTEHGHVKVSDFSYVGERGPINWASLSGSNTLCRSGTTQSPINIDDTINKVPVGGTPVSLIPTVNEAAIENLGTALEVIVNGTTMYQNKPFSLRQLHYHTPSEHHLHEEHFPLEMHMVHQSDSGEFATRIPLATSPKSSPDGSVVVLAILFQLSEDGSSTDLVTSSIENIESVREPGYISKTGRLDFTQITQSFATETSYTYTGSFTTPPCTEGVTFIVLEKPFDLDVKTYNAIKSVTKYNSRYLQNQPHHKNLIRIEEESDGCSAH
ncbi:hypothetical protein VNI00_003623 [Paramarasmius palmivorus]|uniref:Carbonic anhydrase n=1 Tax=Paramarasmius palmivorus TaxID=297713 RepID=A0AAW0DSW0_9AGAR